MPSQLFFVRLVTNRPDFMMSMTADEQAVMSAHIDFLNTQLAAGKLLVAGPVLDPAGVFGMAVFEAQSMEELQKLIDRDPAKAIGRHELIPMAPGSIRPAR